MFARRLDYTRKCSPFFPPWTMVLHIRLLPYFSQRQWISSPAKPRYAGQRVRANGGASLPTSSPGPPKRSNKFLPYTIIQKNLPCSVHAPWCTASKPFLLLPLHKRGYHWHWYLPTYANNNAANVRYIITSPFPILILPTMCYNILLWFLTKVSPAVSP